MKALGRPPPDHGGRLHGARGAGHGRLETRLDHHRGQSVRIMGCGPNAMLWAVGRIARDRGIPCFISLEEQMACGIGVCLGCASRRAAAVLVRLQQRAGSSTPPMCSTWARRGEPLRPAEGCLPTDDHHERAKVAGRERFGVPGDDCPRVAGHHDRRRLFLNPILTASGTFGYGKEFENLTDLGAIGGLVTKGISPAPRFGNATPRHLRDRVGDAELDRPRERRSRGFRPRQAAPTCARAARACW